MSQKKKIILFICFSILLSIVILLLLFYFHSYNRQKRFDLNQLATLEYDSIFCSTYAINTFSQDDFSTYRGINTLKLDNILRSSSDMGQYLSAAFASGNTINNIYLGLDPEYFCNKWEKSITQNILTHVTAHPEVSFHVLLSAPSIEHWISKSEENIAEILSKYNTLINLLDQYSNICTFYFGAEKWLIANPDNYTDTFELNPEIANKIFLYSFCDNKYKITAENSLNTLNTLKQFISQEQNAPVQYPSFSSWDIVFFGDSIIGNYTSSSSVPGVVTALTDASTYNCAKGGAPASNVPGTAFSLPASVDFFIAQDASAVPDIVPFQSSLEKYTQADHTNQNLCFVINYGLNDYFCGYSVSNEEDPYDDTSYAGALRTGINKLQTAYPNAVILVLTPNFINLFTNGTEIMSEQGSILTKYVDAAIQVADEMNVLCFNSYSDLGIDSNNFDTYLEDGCHLNETGRFKLAELIIQQIDMCNNQ